MLGVWIGLGVFLACLAGGGAFVGVRGLAAWRQLKSTKAAFGVELDRINATVAEIEKQLAAASSSQESLKTALARLTASRQRLLLQLAAVGEAQWVVRRILPFLPR